MKLSQINAPALAGVIREKTAPEAIAEILNCQYHGADMVDLHMSCLETPDLDTLKKIVNASKIPILALNYNLLCDWQDRGFTEEERVNTYMLAAEAGVAGIDMQGYTFDENSRNGFCGEDIYSFTKNNPKEIVTDKKIIDKQCELIEKMHSMDVEVLLSCHPGVAMNCQQVVDLALFLEERKPDIIKIVTASDSEEELAECIRTMLILKKEVKTPVSYHAYGSLSSLSRIVNPILGGQIMFCVDRYSETSTFTQLDLQTARTIIDNVRKVK